jgi:membrane dipeptidase
MSTQPTLDEWAPSPSGRSAAFHHQHPVADMLGLNLTHPRFLVDNVDLGVRHDDTCRGDFSKFRDWGLSVVMCKGGPAYYDDNYAALWRLQPEWRPGGDAEPLYLGLTIKNPTQMLLAVLDRFLGQVEANADKVLLVCCAGDLERARSEGVVAVLMGCNRSDWFGDCPGAIRMLARLGLRMITVAQATRELGYDPSNETRSGGGLTELGVQMIHEMNRCGILVDISHLNDVCALDAIAVSEAPVAATHSNPRALEDTLRNVPDEVMRALADKGGVLGIMPPIARPTGEYPYTRVPRGQMERSTAFIRYAVDLMGIEGVGIGTHFNSAVLPWITEGLLDSGFSEEDTARILGGNYVRLLSQVLPH